MIFHSYVSLPEGIQGKIVKYGQPDIFDWFRPTYWWNSCWIYLDKLIFTLIFMVKIGLMGIEPIWGYNGGRIGIEWDKSPTTHFFGPKNATRHGSISMWNWWIKPSQDEISPLPGSQENHLGGGRKQLTSQWKRVPSWLVSRCWMVSKIWTVKHQNSPMFGKPP